MSDADGLVSTGMAGPANRTFSEDPCTSAPDLLPL